MRSFALVRKAFAYIKSLEDGSTIFIKHVTEWTSLFKPLTPLNIYIVRLSEQCSYIRNVILILLSI